MPTTNWSAWNDDVLPEIPGATQAFVQHHVKLAAIDFCSRAWVWIVNQGPIAVAALNNTYPWAPPVGTDVARVLNAWLDKVKIIPKTRNELSELYGDYMQVQGAPQFFIQDLLSTLVLVPTPTAAATTGITAKIAVSPTRAAVGLETEIFETYFAEIAKGAKASLFSMKRKPWTDLERAAQLAAEFEEDIAKAKFTVMRSFAGARMHVRAQFF